MLRRSLLVVGAGALLFATAAAAHFQVNVYAHNQCPPNPPGSRVDPVNIVFYTQGTWDRSAQSVAVHAGWTHGDGSTLTFADHAACSGHHAQRASGSVASSRFHVRVWGRHWGADYGDTSLGGAHHEDLVWYCGHAVDSNGPNGSGFDQGRRELRQRLEAGGHYWFSDNNFGNTANFQQCDGDYAASDGWTVWIDQHYHYH